MGPKQTRDGIFLRSLNISVLKAAARIGARTGYLAICGSIWHIAWSTGEKYFISL